MTMADEAVRTAERGLYVFPCRQGDKRPAIKDWENEATTDFKKISEWWKEMPNANVAIACGPSELAVVDLDTPEAIAWWAENGVDSTAVVNTPSGGKHLFFWVGPETQVETNRSKIYPGVDIRASGGYVVAPGSQTWRGRYVGDVSDIPEAPDELLELLPSRQHFANVTTLDIGDVEPVEVASEQEQRELEWVAKTLDDLPRPWRDGAGWRGTVFQVACYLRRMVRSPWYAINEDQAASLLLEHAPTDDQWGLPQVIAEWEDSEIRTKGQVALQPEETRPPLLPWTGIPTDRALPVVNGEDFTTLWAPNPKDEESTGSLWGRRHKMLVALLRSDFTEQEAATFVWHSGASKVGAFTFDGESFQDEDSRCINERDLWREVDQAREEIEKGTGATIDAAPADERPRIKPPTPTVLLTDAERHEVAGVDWFGRRFLEWGTATFSFVNAPYYRMNRWTILSVIFSPYGVLPRPGANDRSLNLYQAILGLTTSGKSEALRVAKNIFKMYYNVGHSPIVGGNFSPEALTELLIERDGESTWFQLDEAHTKIAIWKKPIGPYSEMPGVLTDVYDGDVGAIHRSTKKEISGKGARAFVTAHFMGTPQGMADVMGPEDWQSGFLNRFVWAIGDKPNETPDSVAGDWIDEDTLEKDAALEIGPDGYPMFRQWCSEFDAAISRVARPDERPNRMRLPKAVIERHKQVAWRLTEIAAEHPSFIERLRPTFRRLGETVMRCAALVALSEGRTNVKMSDLLIAIEQAEEWVTNILIMVEATDETLRTRDVNSLERAVLDAGGLMTMGQVYRLPRFKNQRRYVDELIGELVAQGRVAKEKNGATDVVRMKGLTE